MTMNKTFILTVATLAPAFANAQECTQITDLHQRWSNLEINTELVFRGLGDQGRLTYIFKNPDNGRWSEWVAATNNPSCLFQVDSGNNASSENISFTKAPKLGENL